MPKKSFLSFIGFVLLLVAIYCPLLSPLNIKFLYSNLYKLNPEFALLLMFVAVVGIICVALKQPAIVKILAYTSLVLVVILYAAVRFKIHHFFGFLPFKMAKLLEGAIKYKWGWFVMFAGPVLAVLGIATTKSGAAKPNNDFK